MNLKNIRKKHRITIKELSAMSNVPYRTIQDIEKRNDCRVSTAKKLAKTLKVSLDELCLDPDE